MKLNITYYYNQYFLPTSKHRKTRKRQVADTLSVGITEPTADDFPVAFIVHSKRDIQDGMTSYYDYDEGKCVFRMFAMEIRTYKGKLFSPIYITHGSVISTIFEDESCVIYELEGKARKKWYGDNSDEFSENSIVVDENKEEVKRKLRSAAKDYIYFDGKFWHVCEEPRYVIDTFGLGHNHGGTGFFIHYGYNPNISNTNYFNALQRDEAIAYGKAIALGRGDTESVDDIGKYKNIEVLMPEMVKVNPKKEHGNGDEFLNTLESIIRSSDTVEAAGIGCIAVAMAER